MDQELSAPAIRDFILRVVNMRSTYKVQEMEKRSCRILCPRSLLACAGVNDSSDGTSYCHGSRSNRG